MKDDIKDAISTTSGYLGGIIMFIVIFFGGAGLFVVFMHLFNHWGLATLLTSIFYIPLVYLCFFVFGWILDGCGLKSKNSNNRTIIEIRKVSPPKLENIAASSIPHLSFINNEAKIRFARDYSYEQAEERITELGGEIVGTLRENLYQVRLRDSYSHQELSSICESLEKEQDIDYAFIVYGETESLLKGEYRYTRQANGED